jgi:hypothetical protein
MPVNQQKAFLKIELMLTPTLVEAVFWQFAL